MQNKIQRKEKHDKRVKIFFTKYNANFKQEYYLKFAAFPLQIPEYVENLRWGPFNTRLIP